MKYDLFSFYFCEHYLLLHHPDWYIFIWVCSIITHPAQNLLYTPKLPYTTGTLTLKRTRLVTEIFAVVCSGCLHIQTATLCIFGILALQNFSFSCASVSGLISWNACYRAVVSKRVWEACCYTIDFVNLTRFPGPSSNCLNRTNSMSLLNLVVFTVFGNKKSKWFYS